MKTPFTYLLGSLLLLVSLGGCASPEAWVIVTVRDSLTRAPLQNPEFTVIPRESLLGTPSPATTQVANAFGTARLKLATGQVKYDIIVDAPDYDLIVFSLPNLDAFFPSGDWLEGTTERKYPLRSDNAMELMVTLEP